jgi:excisionase family DNA binding protein
MWIHTTVWHRGNMDEYTIAEAAQLLRMSVNGVRLRIRRGDMQARRIGARLLVIPASEVERWKQRGRLKPGPKPRAQERNS